MIAFRAPHEPALCEEFAHEHKKVLEDFGISNVTESNGNWQQDMDCHVIVAIHNTLGMVGGIRLQLDHGDNKLPMEVAVAKQDSRVTAFLDRIRPFGNGEVCNLWNANRYANKGVPVLLSQAVTAISHPAGMGRMVCLVAPYTKRHPSNNGFRIVEEVGDKGIFAYPRPDFQGIVMLNADTHLLGDAHPLQRKLLLSLRVRPNQVRVEQPGRTPLEVHYCLRERLDCRHEASYHFIVEEHQRQHAHSA